MKLNNNPLLLTSNTFIVLGTIHGFFLYFREKRSCGWWTEKYIFYAHGAGLEVNRMFLMKVTLAAPHTELHKVLGSIS